MINNIKDELKRISKEIEKEEISYSEIFFLQEHKAEVLQMGDVRLAEWAGITEEEWNKQELDLPF